MNGQLLIADRVHDVKQGIVDRALFGDAWSQARQWPAIACTVASLAAGNGHPLRRAYLYISFGQLSSKADLWGARFWEEVPQGAEPIEWLLASERPVACIEDAVQLLLGRPDLVTGLDCR